MSQGLPWCNLYPQSVGMPESSETPAEQCQGPPEGQTQPWGIVDVLWMSAPSPAKEAG